MMRAGLSRLALATVVALAIAPTAWGQGIVVDRRERVPIARSYEVREVSIDARVRDQVAEVRIAQTFHNPGSFPIDAEYLFPLPDDGAIQSLVLLVDGKELSGRLLARDEARRIYEEIVRRKRDPALLEYMGRGLYRTSVFPIPAGADRTVTMRYTQVCKRDRDMVEFAYPLGTQKFTARPIKRLSTSLRWESVDSIKSVYCPTADATVRRDGDHEARVSYEARDVVPSSDFRVIVTLAEGAVGASVLSSRPSASDDGFFLLLAAPKVEAPDAPRRPKTVVFVLDRSGSMAGKKITQARNALKFVLDNLHDGDTFNVIAYDDRVETFRPELQRFGEATLAEAARFVENIREGGSTNIDAALKVALDMIPDDDSRPGYVLFLTDGLPTAGETGEAAITDNAKSANKARARVFAFGVGHDVNARLLDRLSGGNGGTSEYVKPDEDIEAHVARFYSKLTSPVLTDVRIEFSGTEVNRVYPRDVPDLFEGGQLVIAGRYVKSGLTTVTLSGKVGGERRTFEFPTKLVQSGRVGPYDFIEKLWATRRVGDLIDQIDLHGQNKELIDELVALSTRYGIMTPYTSFLADETVELHAASSNRGRTERQLRALDQVAGELGVAQRSVKQFYKSADRAAAPMAPGLGGMAGMGGMGGGMGGMGGRMYSGPTMRVGRGRMRDTSAEDSSGGGVRQVGAKTFYRKAGRWVDAEVRPGDETHAVVVRQFSDAFFKLVGSQSAEENQYLTFDAPVTVKLGGKVYRIEPAG
jgi:Ca-activated chloride channel family protein